MAMVNRDAIRVRREGKKLSISEAARRAKMHNAAKWNDVEKGEKNQNVTLKTLSRIAAVLECEVGELIKE